MAIEGEHKRIVDRLAELTDAGKLQWKPDSGRWLECVKGEWKYRIYMARDTNSFSVKIYEGDKILMNEDCDEEMTHDSFVRFYAAAAAQEPATSILKGLEEE